MATVHPAREPIKTQPDAPTLAICIPTRGQVPLEFMISMIQMLHPLNVKLTYVLQKSRSRERNAPDAERVKGRLEGLLQAKATLNGQGDPALLDRLIEQERETHLTSDVEEWLLPAEARNRILTECLERGAQYAVFFDDDVMFPDLTLYRLWNHIQRHPEAALITGIYPSKLDPTEPLIYEDSGTGAFWDWPLGSLVPIHSAGAGCFIVNLSYVRKLTPPYFNDVHQSEANDLGFRRRNIWGHDRYFMNRLREEAGGVVYADTGLLLGHFEIAMGRNYILPDDSPCFQRPPMGESYIPLLDDEGAIYWKRLLPARGPTAQTFRGYLDWLNSQSEDKDKPERIELLAS